MEIGSRYQFRREANWSLWVLADRWGQGIWQEILHQLRGQVPAARPHTKQFRYPLGDEAEEFYLKIYHPPYSLGSLKDIFRDSKAFRALKQGEALSQLGFHVPLTVAAGEERTHGFPKRAFLLTLGIKGSPLHLFLLEHCSLPLEPSGLRKKREYLKQFALETRRLHQYGFVHGDLIPPNVFVQVDKGEVTFFYMDNDRTRRYPFWFPHLLWKRNLVQLNRFVLPGISLQDRMRFLKFYLGGNSWGKKDRRLIRWLEEKTRQRRREYEQIDTLVSFRQLMKWNRQFKRHI